MLDRPHQGGEFDWGAVWRFWDTALERFKTYIEAAEREFPQVTNAIGKFQPGNLGQTQEGEQDDE